MLVLLLLHSSKKFQNEQRKLGNPRPFSSYNRIDFEWVSVRFRLEFLGSSPVFAQFVEREKEKENQRERDDDFLGGEVGVL